MKKITSKTQQSEQYLNLAAADLNHALVIELNKLFLELAREESTDEKTLEIVVQRIQSIGRRVSLFRDCKPRETAKNKARAALMLSHKTGCLDDLEKTYAYS